MDGHFIKTSVGYFCLLGRYRMNQPRHVHSDLLNAYAEPESLFSLGWMDLDILPRETHTNCRDG